MTTRTRYFLVGSAMFLAIGLTVGLAAYYGGIPSFAEPAGPEELNYVPNDAVVVAYANVRELMDSEFRRTVKGLEPADQQKGQEEFRAETGINIETDIDYVLACMLPELNTSGTDGKGGFVLAKGRFDQARISALIREKGGVEQQYNGRTIFVHSTGIHESAEVPAEVKQTAPEEMALSFVDPQVVAIGTTAAIHRVIDLKSGGHSVRTSGEMMKMIEGVEGGNAWAVGRFDVLSKQAHLPDQVMSQMPAITWFSATGHVNGGIAGTVSVEAKDAQAGDNLRQVVAGFLALGKLQAGSKPELNTVLESITLGGRDTTVSVSFTLPAAAIEMLKGAAIKGHVTKPEAAPKPEPAPKPEANPKV